MTEWEYLAYLEKNWYFPGIEKRFNTYAIEGWELFKAIPIQHGNSMMIFRRPKQQEQEQGAE